MQPRQTREWDLVVGPYDLLQRWLEPHVLRGTRPWIARRAQGRTLEVAIGTGLTLQHYPTGVDLVGVDSSRRMLDRARRRAEGLGRRVDLRLGDAQALDLADDSFDTVVCVFGLCAVRDERLALAEMVRVLRPGGCLLLADHIESTRPALRAAQAVMDVVGLPLPGEHWRRRPLPMVQEMGFTICLSERFLAGAVERVVARAPTSGRRPETAARHE